MKQFASGLILVVWLAGLLPLPAGEIHDAAAAGDVEKVRALLKAKPELANMRELGTTPLHEAAAHGRLPVVELLLASGADPNARNSSGLTPLKVALGYGQKEVAEFLRQHGGVVSLAAPTNAPPAAPAVAAPAPIPAAPPPSVPVPPVSPIAPEVKSPAPPTNRPPAAPAVMSPVLFPIHDAAEAGDAEQVKALIKDWPDLLEAEDGKGKTPLHVAAANARTNVALVLLSRHANLGAKTKAGWTPLHFAAQTGDPATVALLLAYGAPVNARTLTDLTPLHLAASGGRVEAARLLLDHHAEVNVHEKASGSTPLHFAAESGSQRMVELLLARGADSNARDAQGQTPLREHGAQEPQNKPLSPLEQSLVDYYRGIDQAFRSGSASERKKALLSMVPARSDVEKIFPKHSAEAWKIVEQLNKEVHAALDKSLKDGAKEPPAGKIEPAPPSQAVQQYQAKGWIAADVPVYTLVVYRKGGRSIAEEYCFVNNHWVPLPPPNRIFAH